MIELALHPQVYSTGSAKGLINLLEKAWIRGIEPGNGTFYIISGFANYNGGVRFYQVFKNHVEAGGKITVILSGSTSSRLSSKEVVIELLNVGATVFVINRKRLLHAKIYGSDTGTLQHLIVSSGNFTGPGMSQNAEMSAYIDTTSLTETNFKWEDLIKGILSQKWSIYQPTLENLETPAWRLLYDETKQKVAVDDSQLVTMILKLGHNDTARINAEAHQKAGKGTQYFWLSKDCYDFFPPLTIPNRRGVKRTYSSIIKIYYSDLNKLDANCRVTFESENNLDFRLGTGKLKHTKIASKNDLAAISRLDEDYYELRIFRKDTSEYNELIQYATNFIGSQGKVYGYISNEEFQEITSITLGKKNYIKNM